MHTWRVTNCGLPSPWTVTTENLVLGNSWIRSERAGLGASSRNAGVRFTAAVERSWGARRPVNAGLLALSTLQGDVRRRLLGAWMESGGGTASFFAAVADSLLGFIAEQLPDSSPELALCRVEQLTLRATHRAGAFEAPDLALLDPQRVVRQASHAGLVLFPAGSDLILSKLLQREPLPPCLRNATPLIVAPGLQPLCRIASPTEFEIWTRLAQPAAVNALVQNGCPIEGIETMLRIGALEYT
jgi:hypothetical protein